jgi:ABC-type sugar transport system ATPase subunit
MAQSVLTMKRINKSFPGVKALTDVDFELFPGEVHALMGENGAGKSTLMKILSGVYHPTEGEIFLKGKKILLNSPSEAQELGISIIHQEFNLFPNLSAAENIFIDRKAVANSFGKVKWAQIYKEAEQLVQSIGADIDVRKEVQHLSVHSQQVVEIAKALSFNADILIMDEPSAALPENEVQKMFEVINQLKKQGVAIVYVSHRMKEVFEIADKVTVLRDGKKISTKSISETTENQLISMMVGKEVGDLYPEKKKAISDHTILSVKDLTLDDTHKVSFELKQGEILGLFGLVGSGTHTLAERLFGLRKGSGQMVIDGKTIKISKPKHAMKEHIAYVPPDRHRQGLVKEMTVKNNLTLPILRKLSEWSMINKRAESSVTKDYIDKLRIKTPHENQVIELLSGGNQQKVVLSKWLATEAKVLILEEPTRGVDVGAKAEIYQIIKDLAEKGLSILLISSEMPEVIGMSDRILVIYKGEIVKEFHKGEVDQQILLKEASNPQRLKVIG